MGDNNNNNSNPGIELLLLTTAYTALCIIVGFFFSNAKRKSFRMNLLINSRSVKIGAILTFAVLMELLKSQMIFSTDLI